MDKSNDTMPGDPRKAIFVYIVESPSSNDFLNNKYEGKILSGILDLALIKTKYLLVTNKSSFKKALREKLIDAMEETEMFPLLHLSCHGDENGIGLTDGTTINWDELAELLTPVNEMLQDMLCITISSCFGGLAAQMAITLKEKLPFFGLVGIVEEITWIESAIAFATFYFQAFYKKVRFSKAIEAMCSATGILEENVIKVLAKEMKESSISIVEEAFRKMEEKNDSTNKKNS